MKLITTKEYFNEMQQVSEIIKPEINSIIKYIDNKYPLLNGDFNYYYNKRIKSNKNLLRPFLFKEYLSFFNIDWKDHLKFVALIEIVNISTYQSNLAFDNKDGFTSDKQKANQYISSIFSKLRIIDEIVNNVNYTEKQKKLFSKYLIEAYEKIYYGQYIDINELNFANISLINNTALFDNTYSYRCELIGGSLIELIANLAFVIAYKKESNYHNNPLLNFSKHYGLAGQIVNDLGDITAKTGKSYTLNKYSDLKNERLTYPLRISILEINNHSKQMLIKFLNDTNNEKIIKKKTLLYIQPYIKLIEQDIIELKKYNDTTILEFIANLLTKSNYIL